MDVLWMYYGCIMDVLWMYYGCIMDVLWMYYGCIMDIPTQIKLFLSPYPVLFHG